MGFGVFVLIGLLPSYIFCCCGLCRGRADGRTDDSSAARTEQRLRKARVAAAKLRTRVSWFLVQLGFFAFILAQAPTLLGLLVGFSSDVAWGPVTWWPIGQSVGVLLMLLGIRPTDAGASLLRPLCALYEALCVCRAPP